MQPNPRLEKLKLKQEQLKARIKQLEALEKTRQKKQDTRRKILIGAFFLERMEKDETFNSKTLTALDKFLKRDIDRALFEFPEKEQPKLEPKPLGKLEPKDTPKPPSKSVLKPIPKTMKKAV
jgi:hypothetical protein